VRTSAPTAREQRPTLPRVGERLGERHAVDPLRHEHVLARSELRERERRGHGQLRCAKPRERAPLALRGGEPQPLLPRVAPRVASLAR
jgi:hypothetical protein